MVKKIKEFFAGFWKESFGKAVVVTPAKPKFDLDKFRKITAIFPIQSAYEISAKVVTMLGIENVVKADLEDEMKMAMSKINDLGDEIDGIDESIKLLLATKIRREGDIASQRVVLVGLKLIEKLIS